VPEAARASAIAFPMSPEPPVTNATFPLRSMAPPVQISVNAKRRSIPISALHATAKIARTGRNVRVGTNERSFRDRLRVKRLNAVSAVDRLVVSPCFDPTWQTTCVGPSTLVFGGFTFWQWRAGRCPLRCAFRTWRPDGTTSEKGHVRTPALQQENSTASTSR